jgi:ribose-phosphate pyrophosphokinase
VHKRRAHSAFNTVEAKEVVGEVEGKVCILVDDMIDTAGTICAAADQLAERGASRVIAATTHGIFSGSALERLEASLIEKVIVTDTVPLPEDADPDFIEVLSVAPLIARAIGAVFADASVSEIFGGNNLA